MRNILIGVVASATMGAAFLAATTAARADDLGPGPYGMGDPGAGYAVAENGGWGPGPGYNYNYGYSDDGYRARPYPSDGNAGPGPYGMGGPGTGKTVAFP